MRGPVRPERLQHLWYLFPLWGTEGSVQKSYLFDVLYIVSLILTANTDHAHMSVRDPDVGLRCSAGNGGMPLHPNINAGIMNDLSYMHPQINIDSRRAAYSVCQI